MRYFASLNHLGGLDTSRKGLHQMGYYIDKRTLPCDRGKRGTSTRINLYGTLPPTAPVRTIIFSIFVVVMTPQYTYDNNGNPIGVFIPISDWNQLTEKYSDLEEVSVWEKNLIDQRLDFIRKHPDQLIPIEDFIAELDKSDEV